MIGTDRVFIIAEVGVNHNGSLATAFQLVDAAKMAGADAVKFQTWKTENVVTRGSPKAPYQRQSFKETQYEMLKKLELSQADFVKIKGYADKRKIMFLSTADEIESATFLTRLQPIFKVGSAELTDLPFLRKLAKFKKPVILSTGMGTSAEVKAALAALYRCGLTRKEVTVLHCHSEYPTDYKDANLLAMVTMKKEFGGPVGYSDHTLGLEVPAAAVALGARVIEKHLTLDKNMRGPDHKMSLMVEQFKDMVTAIRHVEVALGNGVKKPTQSERRNMPWIRKSIVAQGRIRKGELFSEQNLTVKRPGLGVSPTRWDAVLGRRAPRDFEADELIQL